MKKGISLIAITIILSASLSLQATTRRVLFIGNSYIYTNNLPLLIQQIATSMGDTLIYDENTIGGYTLQAHSTNTTTLNKIKSQAWDIVILQEQSQRPAFSPGQVATDTYPYARILDSLVRDHRPCTETMFFMTWGYKNGDAGNCPVYPPICTYGGMQQRLRESYMQMAQDNNAIVSPVGAAWKQVRDSFPGIELYSPDESHPSLSGTYLAACVFYASIFHKNPITTSVTGGITAADAVNLRKAAGKIVLDSFTKWNQYGNYTYSNFTKSVNVNTITLNNTSVNALTYYWTFGDGNNSTSINPVHTYSSNNKYYITLTASNLCFSETKRDSTIIGPVKINSLSANTIRIISTGNYMIQIQNSANEPHTIMLYNIQGLSIKMYDVKPGTSITDQLSPGVYFYRHYNKATQNTSVTGKIIIY